MSRPTIFWMTVNESDRAALEEATSVHDAEIVRTTVVELSRQVLAAVSRGPVICIVGMDREAGDVLGLGVDEVLRAGEVTTESIENTILRASARAAVRASPEYRHALFDQDKEAAFAQLGDAFGERLETPLAMASVDCAAVAEAINCLVEVDDQFVAWTALVAPSDQLRKLVARRLTAPTAPELRDVFTRLRASIGRAESLVRLLRDLTKSEAMGSVVDVAPLLAEVVDVMRPMISPWADIAVRVDPECATTATRATVVVAVGVVLVNALDSVRAASRERGSISIRVFEEEDAVIIEIRDDGREIPSDLRPHLADQPFADAPTPRKGLRGLRDRVRRAGGDLLVDSQPSGSTVRVFVPSARLHEVVKAAPLPESAALNTRESERKVKS